MSTTAETESAPANDLPPSDWGDPTGKGLLAAMDDIFDPGPRAESPQPEPDKPAPEADKPAAEPQKAAEPPEPESPIIEEEFFSDEPEEAQEPKEAKTGEFNEESFDKETEDVAKGMDAKAGAKWKELRAELKAAKQQTITPEIQTKLQELELKAQEADGLRERLKEISNQSAKLKVEASDEYQREIIDPASSIFNRADELADLYEADKTILRAIIKEKDRKVQNELIAEHLRDFSDFDRNETYRMIQDFGSLVAKRERMLENADKELQRQEVARIEEQNRLLAEQRKAVQTMQKDLWGKYRDVIPGFTEEGEETADYKRLVSKGLSIDFSTAKAKDQAYAAFAGVALPHVVKQLADMRKRLSEYEKSDSRKAAGSPAPSSSITSSEAQDKPKSFMEQFASMDFSR